MRRTSRSRLPSRLLRHSLRLRITLMAGTVTLAVLVGLALLASQLMRPLLVSSVDDELRRVLDSVSEQVRAGEALGETYQVRVRVLNTIGGPVDGGPPTPLSSEQIRKLKAGLTVTGEDADGSGPAVRWLGSVVTAPDGAQRLVVVGAPLAGFEAAIASGSRWLLVIAVVSAAVAGVGSYFGVRSALTPVTRMRRSVRKLPAGRRLPLPEKADELRALAAEFNSLLARQERAAEQLRRFTDDAAHELRSPVASIRVQAEVAVANPNAELAAETLADVLAEAERLSTLLDGLLALARADTRELPPAEPVDLVSEARAAIERLPPDAPPVRLNTGAPAIWALGTHAEVELVADNLLRNACAYAEGQVVVSVLVARSRARLVVDDDGPGVPAEHRQHVFDRFYRADDDRARASGGSGLGLAMVAEAVRGRGGEVSVGESPDQGARFQAAWPMAR